MVEMRLGGEYIIYYFYKDQNSNSIPRHLQGKTPRAIFFTAISPLRLFHLILLLLPLSLL